jgi:hypothetical protein
MRRIQEEVESTRREREELEKAEPRELLRITHTCHALQGSHVFRALASKIASQSISSNYDVKNKSQTVHKSHFKFRSCYYLLPFATTCYFNPNSIPYTISTVDLLPRFITDP